MTKKIIRNLMALAIMLMIDLPMFSFALTAQALTPDEAWGGTGKQTEIKENIGLGNEDPRVMVASILKVAMGFLGIVAVAIILVGGFKWMVAGGDETKIEESVGLIKAGVIGLIIILASFAIATFVINSLVGATGDTATGDTVS